ncbi:MAG: disulfide bond formation protein B [Alphaproteobacteria bacterium]|nr:disulfide bond formation protein B [Alphaproteobacteria bacterium]MBF0250470.1 disulfide bond formation protein B [Alphaproteobacteria bacterium]
MANARTPSALLAAVGALALAGAFTAQYGFGLEPCALCLYQRIPYAIVLGLGVIGMVRPAWVVPVLALATALFAGESALAFYHFGVEQHWWVSGCADTGDLDALGSAKDLLASLRAKPPKPCDEVTWRILGVSMAGWNVVISAVLAGLSALALKTRKWES